MFSKTFLFSLAVALAQTATASVDLTPSPSEYVAEGISFKQLNFANGDKRNCIELPSGWSFRGGGNLLQLVPPGDGRAEAMIQAATLPSPVPFDEKAVALARQSFLSTLPSTAQTITVVKEEANPVLLDGNVTYEITASYTTLGQTFYRSALFAYLPDTQLTFKLTAKKADFEKLHGAFARSIRSWRAIAAKSPGQPAHSAGAAQGGN